MLNVIRGVRPDPPREGTSIPDNIWDIMQKCWAHQPHERPSVVQVSEMLGAPYQGPPDEISAVEDVDKLDAMHTLGVDYTKKHQYGDAEALLERVAAGRETRLGPEHEETLNSMHWLARVYHHQEKHFGAGTCWET
jgi:hypothetical protein